MKKAFRFPKWILVITILAIIAVCSYKQILYCLGMMYNQDFIAYGYPNQVDTIEKLKNKTKSLNANYPDVSLFSNYQISYYWLKSSFLGSNEIGYSLDIYDESKLVLSFQCKEKQYYGNSNDLPYAEKEKVNGTLIMEFSNNGNSIKYYFEKEEFLYVMEVFDVTYKDEAYEFICSCLNKSNMK